MKIIFMGTPEPAAKCLQVLIEAKEEIIAVITQPDRPKGRGLKLTPSPVKELALKNDMRILQPEKLKDKVLTAEIRSLAPELIVVVAYGNIIPKEILDIPKYGCINVHASLLPRYRGAAPIQYAIMKGEKETGVTIFKLSETLDTGDIISQVKVPIDIEDTSRTLFPKIFDAAAKLLVHTIRLIKEGKAGAVKQNDKGATYAPTLKREQGVIDWKQPARSIYNKIRAFDPWPGAHTYHNDKTLKIWRSEVVERDKGVPGKISDIMKGEGFVIGAGEGSLLVLEVQPQAGKRMSAYQFAIGHELKVGDNLPS
ncbi:methionyl-tRNA formyltransferase [Candidatus Margulisiibacteriota bacterium]